MIKIFAISDIHTDYAENRQWLTECAAKLDGFVRVLLVAGDVSDENDTLETTLRSFKQHFDVVCFVPGNHDLWARQRRPDPHSFAKWKRLQSELPCDLGVYTTPIALRVEDTASPEEDALTVLLVPILSWHCQDFDTEADCEMVPGRLFPPVEKVCSDYSKSRWPIQEFLEMRQRMTGGRDPTLYDEALVKEYEALCTRFGIAPQPASPKDWQSDLISWRVDRLNDEIVCPLPTAPGGPLTTQSNRLRRLDTLQKGGVKVSVHDATEYVQRQIWHRLPVDTKESSVPLDLAVSFSHFLPFPLLSPEKRRLFYPPLAKAIGSRYLGCRLMAAAPDVHVFGHTHFGWNARIDELLMRSTSEALPLCASTRYIQAALGYPRERTQRLRSLSVGDFNVQGNASRFLCVAEKAFGADKSVRINEAPGFWSNHYKQHQRDGCNVALAEYVMQALKSLGCDGVG